MAELVLRTGVNPDDPGEQVLVLTVDPAGTAGERAVAALGERGYEGDEVLYLVQTDGWTEHHLADGVLTLDVVVHPAVLESLTVDSADFPNRSTTDPAAVRVLRVTAEITDNAVPTTTAVFTTPLDEDDWPLILAPAPV
jgi:hypothetical protein